MIERAVRWKAELWNKKVDRVLKVGSGPTFTPFPADVVAIDYDAGRLQASRSSDYLVVSERETRFGLFASSQVATKGPLELVCTRHPYRLAWATGGVTSDGWTRARSSDVPLVRPREGGAARSRLDPGRVATFAQAGRLRLAERSIGAEPQSGSRRCAATGEV